LHAKPKPGSVVKGFADADLAFELRDRLPAIAGANLGKIVGASCLTGVAARARHRRKPSLPAVG